MDSSALAYRLVRQPVPGSTAPPALDEDQQRVVSHAVGPLLVLAGPGTGKTTAIVEAVVHRISHRGIDPARVLVLTFSRKAAEELRDRITLRLGRTTRQPLALTFHSYAYALVRREFGWTATSRRCCCPARSSCWRSGGCCAARRRTAAGTGRSGSARRSAPGASPPNCATSCSARPSAAWTGAGWPARPAAAARRLGRGRRLPRAVRRPLRPRPGARLRLRGDRPDRRRAARPGRDQGPGAPGLRRRAGRRVPGHRPGAGGPAARAGRGRPGADRGRRPGPVDLRVPRRRHPRHQPVHRTGSAPRTAARRR